MYLTQINDSIFQLVLRTNFNVLFNWHNERFCCIYATPRFLTGYHVLSHHLLSPALHICRCRLNSTSQICLRCSFPPAELWRVKRLAGGEGRRRRRLADGASVVRAHWPGRRRGRGQVKRVVWVYLPCNYEYDLICGNNKRSELGN